MIIVAGAHGPAVINCTGPTLAQSCGPSSNR
jgi:hypothetical protein